jgi:hypothetical protein
MRTISPRAMLAAETADRAGSDMRGYVFRARAALKQDSLI